MTPAYLAPWDELQRRDGQRAGRPGGRVVLAVGAGLGLPPLGEAPRAIGVAEHEADPRHRAGARADAAVELVVEERADHVAAVGLDRDQLQRAAEADVERLGARHRAQLDD